jgi:hypothetical protein
MLHGAGCRAVKSGAQRSHHDAPAPARKGREGYVSLGWIGYFNFLVTNRMERDDMFPRKPNSKERLALSLLGLKAEADGGLGITALVAIAALLFTAKWLGFL